MPRILFFVLVVFLVWLAVRWLGGLRKPAAREADAEHAANEKSQKTIQTMRQCAWCGAHVPEGDAVPLPDGRVYCSDAHRDVARDAARHAASTAEPPHRE